MKALPRPATLAGVKVFFVVCAHLWRDARDIVPPARQYLAYVGSTHSLIPKTTTYLLQLDRFRGFRLPCHHFPALQQSLAWSQCFLACPVGNFGMVLSSERCASTR